jgi:hypothetical protein
VAIFLASVSPAEPVGDIECGFPFTKACAGRYTIRAAIGVSVNRPIQTSQMNKCSLHEQLIEYGWHLCQVDFRKENPDGRRVNGVHQTDTLGALE